MEPNQNTDNKKTVKNRKFKIIVISILAVIAILVGSFSGYTYYQLGKLNITEISKNDDDLGITRNPDGSEVAMDNDIVNIALFGVDRRKKEERGLSDSILIATIDKNHKKIKLSSIMRDTYVKIDGHGMDKINHAYSYGGPQLAIRTINENFNMNIRDFVQVDFYGLQAIIDAFGGVTMDIKKEEVKEINNIMWELALLENTAPHNLTEPGPQLLDGMQAVTYARIRHVGNGDFERTDRQRRVLGALLGKVKEQGPLKFPYLVSQLLPYIETSMDKSTILKLGTQVFAGNMLNFEQMRFPLVKASQDMNLTYGYYLWTDLKATTDHIHTFIYDDVIPEVKPGDIIEGPPKSLTQRYQTAKPQQKPSEDNGDGDQKPETPTEQQTPTDNQQPSTPEKPSSEQPQTEKPQPEKPQGDKPAGSNTQTQPQPPAQTKPAENSKPVDTQPKQQ